MPNAIVTLILLPIIILVLMTFVFSNFVSNNFISNQIWLLNCPLPIPNGIAGNFTIVNNEYLSYTVTQGGANNTDKGTYFDCSISQNQPNFRNIIKPYGATFAGIAYGQIAWFGDNIYVLLGKIQPAIQAIYNYLTLPSQVTGIIYFDVIEGILLLMVGIGVFLAIRAGGGG